MTRARMTVPLLLAIVVASFLPRPAAGETSWPSEVPPHDHPGGLLDLALLPTSVLNAPWPQGPGKVVSHTAGASVGRRSSGKIDVFTTGHSAAEPTIGVDGDGTIFTVAIDTSSGLPRWPVLKSSNGGKTWADVSPKLPTGEFTHFTSQDGMLYVDDATDRVFMSDFTGPCAPVSFTDDDGETWTTGAACGLADHQNVFTGPPSLSETVGYPNVVYYCAVDGGALQEASTMTGCVKSIDGGRTFVRTGSPPYVDGLNPAPGNFGIPGRCSGVTGHGFVDHRGTVYIPRGWCGQPWLAISEDEGATWRRVQVAGNGMPSQSGGPADYNPEDATGFQEHEAGVAVDEDGTICYFYTGMNRLPYLVFSRDEGVTWSHPLMVGAPGLREASLPAIDIDRSGRLALTYIGSVNAPGGDAPDGAGEEYAGVTWNGYITVVDTPLTARSKFHTATVNDPSDPLVVGECWILRCQQQYDFIDVVLDRSGRAWASMVDGCTGMLCSRMGQGIVASLTLPR